LQWLRNRTTFDFEEVDVCDRSAVERIVSDGCYDAVIHLAAQVAVTTSVVNPRMDFMVNALGTFNVLDAVRLHSPEAVVIFASTNKVYGKVNSAATGLVGGRHAYKDRSFGISESELLDFLSPYGCSKGAADQYTLDFARIYGIPATSFRQSCIYGPQQFGVEDQGWLAWFAIASLLGRDITIYGDGNQVRDVFTSTIFCALMKRPSRLQTRSPGRPSTWAAGRTISFRSSTSSRFSSGGSKEGFYLSGRIGGRATSGFTSATSASSMRCWAGGPRLASRKGWLKLVDWVEQSHLAFDPAI